MTANPEMYGYTLAGFLAIFYGISVPMFLKAGQNYKAFKEKF